MKKLAIASLIALAATSASALEVGINTTRDYSGRADRDSMGITVEKQFGRVGVTGGFERFSKGLNDQDRFSLAAGYDLARIGTMTFGPKIGVAYLDNQRGKDGYAMTVGAGASMRVTKRASVNLDVVRQMGQDSVKQFNGNLVGLGVSYKF